MALETQEGVRDEQEIDVAKLAAPQFNAGAGGFYTTSRDQPIHSDEKLAQP